MGSANTNLKLTLAVGTRRWSSWSLRAWAVLKASGLAFDEIFVPLREDTTSAAARAASPSGLVPALTIDDGRRRYTVWDSLAIAETVAELAPDAGLWPRDVMARAHARSISAEMHSGFAELRRQYPMNFLEVILGIAPSEGTAAAITRITSIWNGTRDKFGAGGDFLFGAFGIADAFYAPVVSRFHTYGVTLTGAAAAYQAAMWAHPFMREWGEKAGAE